MTTTGTRADYALVDALENHLGWLLTHGYSHATVRVRRFELRNLAGFLAELGIFDVGDVSFSALESYQRNQYHHRKADGTPLSFRTQSHRLVAVKLLFSWLVRQGQLGFDPAAAIELPKVERRLPEATLSAEEAEAVLAGPDVPPPLDDLLARLVRERRPYSGVGSPALSTWLFPGLGPGTPLSAYQLGQRLRRLGIEPAPARRSALGHLAARLPAAMVAQVLGLSPLTAVRWAGSVGADWATYAAQFSRAQAVTAH